MAERCDLPKSTMDGYLKGVTPGLDAIEKISKGTNISVAGLLASWTSKHRGPEDFVNTAAIDELTEFFESQIRRARSGRNHALNIEGDLIGGVSPKQLASKLAFEISATAQGLQQLINGPEED